MLCSQQWQHQSPLFYSRLFSSTGREESPPIRRGWLGIQKGNKDSVTTPNQYRLKALHWRPPRAPTPKIARSSKGPPNSRVLGVNRRL
jgi:hypothetical protein